MGIMMLLTVPMLMALILTVPRRGRGRHAQGRR